MKEMRRKLLTLTLLAASIAVSGLITQAGTTVSIANSAYPTGTSPQWPDRRRDDNDWRRNYRRFRVERRVQVVRRGWGLYRETWEIRYLPNGRVQRVLVDRDRIR